MDVGREGLITLPSLSLEAGQVRSPRLFLGPATDPRSDLGPDP